MNSVGLALLLAPAMLLAQAVAPPAIDPAGVVNDASRMPPSLPGGSLARGSRFHIEGPRLGPARAVRGDERRPVTELGGVSVTVAARGKSWKAGLVAVSSTSIDGVLPADIPVGPATVTVSFGGQSSVPAEVRVVESSFGIYEMLKNSAGRPARRGETVGLSGTGIGVRSSRGPVEVLVGGRVLGEEVRVAALECCAGKDEIRFRIPAEAPVGCDVPVVVRAGGHVSNAARLDIGSGEGGCRQFDWALSPVFRSTKSGWALLGRIGVRLRMADGRTEDFVGETAAVDVAQRRRLAESGSPFVHLPPPGTCMSYAGDGGHRGVMRMLTPEARRPAGESVEMGEGPRVVGGDGESELQGGEVAGSYASFVGGSLPVPGHERGRPRIYAQGKAEVRFRDFSMSIPVEFGEVWLNPDEAARVSRARGVSLQLRRHGDEILVGGAANVDRFTGAWGMCLCTARDSARVVRLPAAALANLPASRSAGPEPISYVFVVALPRKGVDAEAPGLDQFLGAFAYTSMSSSVFQ